MKTSLLRLGAVGLALLSGQACAIGFGEITLASRIGEPLRAEVGIVAEPGAPVDTACFSLASLRDSDLPVVSAARLHLYRKGQALRLMVSGDRPVLDPIIVLALRAGCGVELQRDYVLMPQAPLDLPEAAQLPAADTAPSLPPARPRPGKPWLANAGETLEEIAATLYAGSPRQQKRMLAALQRANPELDPDIPLAAGTEVRVPKLRKPVPKNSQPPARTVLPAGAPAGKALSAPATEAMASQAPANVAGGDRLVLGAPPPDLKPGEKPVPPTAATPAAMEERMLKMENTLHLLNEEIAKLNQALALTTEALAAQQKLQAAQAAIQPKLKADKELTPPAVAAPAAAPPTTTDSWIELLLSAVAGGIVAALAAHHLATRRKKEVDSELPLAVRASHLHAPALTAQAAIAVPPVRPATDATNDALDTGPEARAVEVTEGDNSSLFKIAEIMLSFGRIHDAAETLAQYIEKAAPGQVEPWIMLLDLYRRSNMPKHFGKLAPRIRERFNIHVPDWDEARNDSGGLKTLEDYPHLIAHLTRTWGRQECMDFLGDLIRNTRSGHREGFPLEVIEEIALLMLVLEGAYGLKRL